MGSQLAPSFSKGAQLNLLYGQIMWSFLNNRGTKTKHATKVEIAPPRNPSSVLLGLKVIKVKINSKIKGLGQLRYVSMHRIDLL